MICLQKVFIQPAPWADTAGLLLQAPDGGNTPLAEGWCKGEKSFCRLGTTSRD